MSLRGRLALVLTATLVVALPLVMEGGSASAATPTARASTSLATVGQALTFSGTVPGGARRVVVYRWWANANQTPITGTSNSSGAYAISRRMMAMPTEYYRVVVPASNGQSGWSSSLITIKNQMQDVNLTWNGSTFTAQPTLTTMNLDGSNPRTVNAGIDRVIALQHRNPDATWTTIQTSPKLSDNTGYSFREVSPSGAYRVLMLQASDGVAAYPSFPIWTSTPRLISGSVSDPAGRNLRPMPDSGNGAAQNYLWWPSAAFWDAEQGEGLSGVRGQGCTSNCVPWSDYATGTGRVAVTDGQIALDSGYADKRLPIWGNLSSTMQIKGWTSGRWEMRAHHSEYVCPSTCSTAMAGRVPFTTRVSLVPAGTPDGVTPSKRIVLAEWTGYNPNTKIRLGQGTGKASLSRTVVGVQWNRVNWNDVAVQITKARIVWFINGKPVGQANGAATFGTAWVPRIEMVSTSGKLMDRARSGLDWVRYFGPNRPSAKPVPTVTALR